MIGYPFTSLLGAGAILAIMATTWWVEGMRITLIAGVPWLLILSAVWWAVQRRQGA